MTAWFVYQQDILRQDDWISAPHPTKLGASLHWLQRWAVHTEYAYTYLLKR